MFKYISFLRVTNRSAKFMCIKHSYWIVHKAKPNWAEHARSILFEMGDVIRSPPPPGATCLCIFKGIKITIGIEFYLHLLSFIFFLLHIYTLNVRCIENAMEFFSIYYYQYTALMNKPNCVITVYIIQNKHCHKKTLQDTVTTKKACKK